MSASLEIGNALTLSCPIIGALFAFMILLLDTDFKKSTFHIENHVLMAYFLTVIINLTQIVSLHYNPAIYIWTSWIGLLTHGLIQIFFYWFVEELTRMNSKERFSIYHFFLPIFLSFVLLIMLVVNKSIEPLVDLVNGKNKVMHSSYLLTYMGNIYSLKIIFGIVYVVFSCTRLVKYNRFIRDYSANEEKASLRWLWFLVFITVVSMPFPLIWIVMKGRVGISLLAIMIYSFILLFFYVYLTHHVLRKDRFSVLLAPDKDDIPLMVSESYSKKDEYSISKKSILNKDLFESYIIEQKPYLNQDLRITDLVNVFHVNRTYISSFINVEYNMNFSSYINNHRMEEFVRLTKQLEHAHKSKQELAELAGFNSYRSFLRIKKDSAL